MRLTLGFSSCPNDTFIFDAMIHGRIDTEGLHFEPYIADVEDLNQKALAAELDITKLSYFAFAHVTADYVLLNAGSALGNNCGPLLIARGPQAEGALRHLPVAIPGRLTTAHFLLSLAYPDLEDKRPMLFSDIESAVLAGDCAAGLIIHENRFTYAEKGLSKLQDLGEYWEQRTGFPIPLGGIAARRGLDADLLAKIDRVMRRSVAFAFAQPDAVMPFVRQHAQEMDEAVMRQHIGLYVNDYTLALGERGRAAIETLFAEAKAKNIIPQPSEPLILPQN